MILADSHSHVYFDVFENDIDNVIKNALENKVNYIFVPSTESDNLEKTIAICDKYKEICFPMVGLHPTSVKDKNLAEEIIIYRKYLDNYNIYGIGETGIDLYWDKANLEQQKQSFVEHIKLALEYDLPLVIHTRNSFDETISVLKANNHRNLKGVFHCFSGNTEQAKQVLDLGFKIGITGVVTYKNSEMAEVVKNIGIEHLMLETDAPFLTPVPHRGKRNEPAYIYHIALKVSELLNLDFKTVADTSTNNTLQLFLGKNNIIN